MCEMEGPLQNNKTIVNSPTERVRLTCVLILVCRPGEHLTLRERAHDSTNNAPLKHKRTTKKKNEQELVAIALRHCTAVGAGPSLRCGSSIVVAALRSVKVRVGVGVLGVSASVILLVAPPPPPLLERVESCGESGAPPAAVDANLVS
jgi:hypothetical protein